MVSHLLPLCLRNVFDKLHGHTPGLLDGLPALRGIRPDLFLALDLLLLRNILDQRNSSVCNRFDLRVALFSLLMDLPLGLLNFCADLCQDTAVCFRFGLVRHFLAGFQNFPVFFATTLFGCRGHGFTRRNKWEAIGHKFEHFPNGSDALCLHVAAALQR